MNNNTIIIGKGNLGTRLAKELGCTLCDEKVFAYQDVANILCKYQPQTIINCVGFIGESNVDDCENAVDRTLMANTLVPIFLAEAAIRHNLRLVHISSGCIYHFDYDSQAPLKEEEPALFKDLFYSRTKIYAENALSPLLQHENILTLRIRIPLDDTPHPKNLLSKLIEYKKVIDVPNSVTYIPDFIRALKHLLAVEAKGVFNVVNKGALRYPDLMDLYKKYVPDFDYEILSLDDLNLIRTNLILSTQKLEDSGFAVRPIEDVIGQCVKNFVANQKIESLNYI